MLWVSGIIVCKPRCMPSVIYTTRDWGGGDLIQGASDPMAEIAGNCGKLRGKLQCRNQTSRSLKEQHLCTGDTQGSNKRASWTGKKAIAEKCGQLPKIAGNCEIAKHCGPQPTPPCSPHEAKREDADAGTGGWNLGGHLRNHDQATWQADPGRQNRAFWGVRGGFIFMK